MALGKLIAHTINILDKRGEDEPMKVMEVAGNARNELEQAQIICVIGKDSLNTAILFLTFFADNSY